MVLTLGTKFATGNVASGLISGFKLNSLLKLEETKSKDKQTTLLHYLKTWIHEKAPELMDFAAELPHLDAAAKSKLEA